MSKPGPNEAAPAHDERVITGADCIAEGTRALIEAEPRFAKVYEATGDWPLRRRVDGYEALSDAIIGQQVSVAAAAAIGGRVRAAGFDAPHAVLAASDEALRACGLSRPKARYLRALAAADLDYGALRTAPTQEVIDALVAIPGIGRWTAEIYALFALGRADAFPAGDLALQEAARVMLGLDARPSEGALRRLAEPWRPWRGVAARALWAYYREVKGREGTA
ncbi:DNA-3-methyladenine glycosylase family protein [Profundibacterium mesophilum]|uniref:DNA-3-methyladenine glycosylase II n=1 Tax=Profundibacterium mesophilum KAUST100406-0324 TaxID=1037889 RepID=A0A921NR61_9RHOB|nr:DNA-3-methyladenine glycosylase 2 family protein [Profundibacterium mesophilum]KAF0677511.1 DNA-3-methyladenine glycosidase II [Profundibacterium mesophilum KAUST100406-0324]